LVHFILAQIFDLCQVRIPETTLTHRYPDAAKSHDRVNKNEVCMRRYSFIIALGLLLALPLIGKGQASVLEGPLIVGETLGDGSDIVFHDVGTMDAWNVVSNTLGANINHWSPDGCYLMMENSNLETYSLIDVDDRIVIPQIIGDDLPRGASPDEYTLPRFSDDGRMLAYTMRPYIYDQDTTNDNETTTLVIFDIATLSVETTFTIEAQGFVVGWESETEIRYRVVLGYREIFEYILDTTTGESYETEISYRVPNVPEDWYRPLFQTVSSPDGVDEIGYYSYDRYYAARREANSELDTDLSIDPESVIPVPGFELYLGDTAEIHYVDLSGEFVNEAVWSPDGSQIAFSSFQENAGGIGEIFIYDVVNDELRQIGQDLVVHVRDTEFGAYHLEWSHDGAWLAFNTNTFGWVAYRLDDDYVAPLSHGFGHFTLRVHWSPVMDYSAAPCD
jgi:WD40 repeat protein